MRLVAVTSRARLPSYRDCQVLNVALCKNSDTYLSDSLLIQMGPKSSSRNIASVLAPVWSCSHLSDCVSFRELEKKFSFEEVRHAF